MFVAFSFSTKRAIQALLHSFNQIFDISLFFSALVLIYAVIGYNLLGGDISEFETNEHYDHVKTTILISNLSEYQ